jgi:predicted enzyme related to lactoylglutathione lyase
MDWRLELVQVPVSDVDRAKAFYESERGIGVSEIQDLDWGSFVFFSDPDGNGRAVQQVRPRGASR